MDRFMDNVDPEKRYKSKAIQAELNACRDRLRLLLESKVSDQLTLHYHWYYCLRFNFTRTRHIFLLSRTRVAF
jgi:hypothetical protein